MNITQNINKVSFTQKSQDQKDAEKKVVTDGGAAAAAVSTVNKAKSARKGLVTVDSVDKFSKGMSAISESSKAATNAVKKATTLWGKICENVKWAKNSITNWSTKVKTNRFIKPILTSRLFNFSAGAIGLLFGVVTLISGIGEITKATIQPLENLEIFKNKEEE